MTPCSFLAPVAARAVCDLRISNTTRLLIDRHDADPAEVQALVDHHLDAVVVQTLVDEDGRRVTLRGGVFVGTPLTAARADAFRLLAGQASVALRNDQLLSEITAIHEELEHQAGHDALTGLPNRVLLLRSITEELSLPDTRPALLFLDLDGFKPVNDRLGHDVGDTLLRLVASRLTSAVPEGALVARVGGDEFTILLRGKLADSQAMVIAERVRRAITDPFEIGGTIINISTSVGLAFGSAEVQKAELIRRADVAMYQAKRSTTSVAPVIYRPEFDEAERRRANLVTDFRRALFQNEIELAHQPIYVAGDELQLCGVEALVRWNHPELGPVPPGEILEIAQTADARDQLHRWIASHACRAAVAWVKDDDSPPIFVAINASPEELESRSFMYNISAALAESGLSPDRLYVEISERLVSPEIPQVLANMQALQVAGVRMLLDDFGEGQTSLSYLHELPVAGIKLDRKLVVNSLRSETDRIVLESIVELCHRLGLTVIAEGVETSDQLEAITLLGSNLVQGYHLGRPQRASDIAALLDAAHRVGDGGIHSVRTARN